MNERMEAVGVYLVPVLHLWQAYLMWSIYSESLPELFHHYADVPLEQCNMKLVWFCVVIVFVAITSYLTYTVVCTQLHHGKLYFDALWKK